MIYSKENQFLFIHLPKTGGTSVERALSSYGGNPGFQNFIGRRLERYPSLCRFTGLAQRRTFDGHTTFMSASQLLTPIVVESLFVFAFVRHPLDRLVSFYRHIIRHTEHPWHPKIKGYGDFTTMVEHLEEVNEPTQLSYLIDGSGKNRADFVGRMESLNADFAKVTRRLGINASLTHTNAAPQTTDYESWYDERTRRLAIDYYLVDFNEFGYGI